ncbi:MAG: hypothetical protein RMJ36_06980 [Candidatus Calescibacterium sp.]|nr:hypothetical protein [Candidatus Calescibacterium sp.]MDW8133380.1 hypothetical protein [Candidatus Calescibacterium sp.]
MKIFIGTEEIAGYYITLHRAFNELGIKSDYYCLYHIFEYSSIHDYNTILGKLLYLISKYRYLSTKNKKRIFKILSIKRFSWFFFNSLLIIIRFILLISSIFKYNTFIFTFGESILPMNMDLPILKLFKKKIIFNIFHGSEARPIYIDLYGLDLKQKEKTLETIYKQSKTKKRKIQIIEKYSDYIVCSFFISHFLSKKYEFLYIGYIHPLIEETNNETKNNNEEKIVILHAPSKPIHKGTEKIREAIKKIKDKYSKIEYIEIINKPHREVLKAIKQCDFIIDQLYSDMPLVGLGVEGALYAKPTIIGGYIWENFQKIHENKIIPPSFICNPEDIEQSIEFMINNQEFRISLGKKAKEFVITNWSPKTIANKFLKIINNDFPQEWYKEPIKDYAHFAAIDEKTGKEFLKAYIEKYGPEALFLDNKPLLKKAFLKLIEN